MPRIKENYKSIKDDRIYKRNKNSKVTKWVMKLHYTGLIITHTLQLVHCISSTSGRLIAQSLKTQSTLFYINCNTN